MNVNRILQMLIRMVVLNFMRRGVNWAINRSADAISRSRGNQKNGDYIDERDPNFAEGQDELNIQQTRMDRRRLNMARRKF